MTKRLLIVDLGSTWGGQEVYSLNLGRALAESGWQIHRLTSVPRFQVFEAGSILASNAYSTFPTLAKRVHALAAGVDLIHFNGVRAMYLSAITPKRVPFVGTKHTRYANPNMPGYRQWAIQQISPMLLQRLDRLILVSASMAHELPPSLQARTRAIPNGVHPCSSQNRSERFTIGFVGRLSKGKGILDLVQACALLAGEGIPFNLLIAGSGELEAEVRTQVQSYNLEDHIELLGFLEDASQVYARSNVCVLPSTFEGMPLTLLEAFSTGCPAIGYDIPGVNEVIIPGETGLLATPGPDGLKSALRRLALDSPLTIRLGAGAQAAFQKHYTISRMVEATEEVYREVLPA